MTKQRYGEAYDDSRLLGCMHGTDHASMGIHYLNRAQRSGPNADSGHGLWRNVIGKCGDSSHAANDSQTARTFDSYNACNCDGLNHEHA